MKINYSTYISLVLLTIVFFLAPHSVYSDSVKSATDPNSPVTIILSPHFDDAVLSLGGLISTDPKPLIVATFFTGAPKRAVKTEWDKLSGFLNSKKAHSMRYDENSKALYGVTIKNYDYLDYQYDPSRSSEKVQKSIEKDIENLIALYPKRQIKIYGPSIFTEKITHPDHRLAHQAFYNVFLKHKDSNLISFYFYEDFPYINLFEKENSISILQFLQNIYPEVKLTTMTIPLSKKTLKQKLSHLAKYSSQMRALSPHKSLLLTAKVFMINRCKAEKLFACEVVYQIK